MLSILFSIMVGEKQVFFQADDPAVAPAGKFMFEAIRVYNFAISFKRNDFSENLFRGNGLIKGSGCIPTKNKKE